MIKLNDKTLILRSALFVPGLREDLLTKATSSGADCLFLDLEDGVPAGFKTIARDQVRLALDSGTFSPQTVFVRINSFSTVMAELDLEAVLVVSLAGIVLPQCETSEQILVLEAHLQTIESRLKLSPGHFKILALIESPSGILNAARIALASPRMAALVFGCEDYLAALQGQHSDNEIALLAPRAMIAMAARAAEIEPLDTPYVRVHDLQGLKRFAQVGRDLGMSGMCALSPRQIPIIHEIYTPSETEIARARMILESAQKSNSDGRGVMITDGQFVSPPTVRAARKIIARAEAIRALEESRR